LRSQNALDIFFATRDLETLCNNQREQQKRLGTVCAKKLRARLADLAAVSCVAELVFGKPHPLQGELAGQFSLALDGGRRLVFRPSSEPPPTRDDGGIAWQLVTSIVVTFIGDYHD
jgi:proteic killer suppression protein